MNDVHCASRTASGWSCARDIGGGGVAYAFTDSLIGRIEYLHADYGPFSYTGASWNGYVVDVTDTRDTVRIGLSWKFAVP